MKKQANDQARATTVRRRLYEILEHGSIGDRIGPLFARFIIALIIVNLVVITLQSVPALEATYAPLFTAVEVLSLIVFTLEYALRIWVAAEHAPFQNLSESKARWRYLRSP